MIDRLAREVPAEFADGIVAIEVSSKVMPHPRRGDVYTLGECIHLEWRAHVSRLEAYDWAAEENFKRHEGQPFDPLFYRSGESVEDGVWKVDDDFFVAWNDSGARGKDIEIPWHGRAYRVAVPPVEPTTALFLILDGLRAPPPGDAVVVVKPAQGLRDLLRRHPAPLQVVAR